MQTVDANARREKIVMAYPSKASPPLARGVHFIPRRASCGNMKRRASSSISLLNLY